MTSPVTTNVLRQFVYGRGYPTINKSVVANASGVATLPVPGSRNFRMTSITGVVTTSAAMGNRTVTLEFQDNDGTVVTHTPQSATIPANMTRRFMFAVGGGASFVGGDNSQIASLPDIISPVGSNYVVAINGFQTGDTLTSLVFYYDELEMGEFGYMPGANTAGPAVIEP